MREHLGGLVVADGQRPFDDLPERRAVDLGDRGGAGTGGAVLGRAGDEDARRAQLDGEVRRRGQRRVGHATAAVGGVALVGPESGDGGDDAVGDVALLPLRAGVRSGEQRVVVGEPHAAYALSGQRARRLPGEGAEVGAVRVDRLVLLGRLAGQVRVAAADQHQAALLALPLEHHPGGEPVLRTEHVQGGRRREQLGGGRGSGPAAGREDRLPAGQVDDRRHDVLAEVGVGEQRLQQARDLGRREAAFLRGVDRGGDGRRRPGGGQHDARGRRHGGRLGGRVRPGRRTRVEPAGAEVVLVRRHTTRQQGEHEDEGQPARPRVTHRGHCARDWARGAARAAGIAVAWIVEEAEMDFRRARGDPQGEP